MRKRLQKPLEGKRNNAPLLPIRDLVFLRSSSTLTDPIRLDSMENWVHYMTLKEH